MDGIKKVKFVIFPVNFHSVYNVVDIPFEADD